LGEATTVSFGLRLFQRVRSMRRYEISHL
jgi:hypothetical protein